jgi:O-antigen ligase
LNLSISPTLSDLTRREHSAHAAARNVGDLAYAGTMLFVVFVSLIFGGGTRQGLWSDALVQIVSLPLLAVAILRLKALASPSEFRLALFVIGAVIVVPILQLVPLPPRIWTILPGRAEVAEAYRAAGVPLPFLPVSLEPLTTLRSLLSLLPAIAVFLGVLSLRRQAEFRWLLLLIFAVAVVGAGLELLQLAGGVHSPLRFYEITNVHRGVGFFANSNHQAAFLYATIGYVAIWAGLARRDRSAKVAFRLTVAAVLVVAIVIGLVATQSRFGVLLALAAGFCGIPLAAGLASEANRGRIVKLALVANGLALLLAFLFGFAGFADRISEGLSSDVRWPAARITWKAAVDHFPFGSGIGTFAPIYQRYEPVHYLAETYVNRAHNDWLEAWLEGGVASAAVICALLGCYVFLAYRSWRPADPNARLVAYARAGSVCIALLMVHSLLDYPLRTTALTVMVAISCAFMIRAYFGVPRHM